MIQIQNEFTTYEFTDQELLEACRLSVLQKAWIQHQIGILAAEKISMKLESSKLSEFTQNEAHIAGQIEAYKFILASSDWSETAIREGLTEMQKQAHIRSRSIYQPDLNPGNQSNPNLLGDR